MKKGYVAGVVVISFLLSGIAYADIVISGAGDIVAEATSQSGAAISFSPTASDGSESIPVSCEPVSGSVFAIGTTTVTCTASATTTVEATFTVSVVDTTPPAITAPADQSFTSATFPASPTLLQASATDAVDASPLVEVSTTTFSVGTTTVTWTATDESGNSSTTTSQIAVYLNIETEVDVDAACEVTDRDGVVHAYEAGSPTAYLAVCAVDAALESGALSAVSLSNEFPSFGLFVTAFNGVEADPSSQYWALFHNDGFASLGLTQLPVAEGDSFTLELHDFSDNLLGASVTIHIDSLIATSTATSTDTSTSSGGSGGGGGGSVSTPASFNVAQALAFLSSQQGTNGSFSSAIITDWIALAFAAQDPGEAKTKLRAYLLTNPSAGSATTDFERRAMALMALGIDPYSGTATNYIQEIVHDFDGTQIGQTFVHDDIFALFPLLKAGYSQGDTVIQKSVAYIVEKQSASGSWGDPDSTSAAVQALSLVPSLPGVGDALTKAKAYLHTQNDNAGLDNSFSVGWALQAIAAFGESPSGWMAAGKTPLDTLASLQQTDGGVGLASAGADSRVWATAYAVPGALGKTWGMLLNSFSKPAVNQNVVDTSLATATSTATSTVPIIATSTEMSATSTPEIATTTVAMTDEVPAIDERFPERAAITDETPRTSTNTTQRIAAPIERNTLDENTEKVPTTTEANPQLAAAGSAAEGLLTRIGGFFKRVFGFLGRVF